MNCPKCETELQAVTIHEVEVDRCPHCSGVWLDRSEFGRLVKLDKDELAPLLRGSPDEELDARAGKCPRDGDALLRARSALRPEVVLDYCGTCQGVWLDAGELGRLRERAG
ncbi:MAG: zf-TFIIB domain-containing protein [Planctomycetota bacterium]